ncbi:MAG: hypothetical protein IPJ65_32320 [Archangiaceae bacterium]|nr:hypothetical protein [Archangiaceae bacterium]
MKKLKLKAPKAQLRERVSEKAESLKAEGAGRVLVVYDDAEHARVYEERRKIGEEPVS